MNKDFFASFEQRVKEFGERGKVGEHVRAELVLVTGRSYLIEAIVEAADVWVQIDGHDVTEEEIPASLVLPYHQISHVMLTKPRVKMRQAGFGRS